MNANVHGKMVYSSKKKMWHNITEPSDKDMTSEEVLDGENFQGGFSIYLRPAKVLLNGEEQETGSFGIVRGASPYDQSERMLGFCSDRFHPLQPREVCRAFDTNVLQPAETMAFLGHGEDMFISWKMPGFDVMTVDGSDPLELFGIVRTGFDTLKGTRLFTSTFRPICSNTINMAEGWAKANTDGAGRGNIWKGKAVNKNLLRDLGYWMAHVQGTAEREAVLLQNFFSKLAKTPIKNDEEAKAILVSAYPERENVSGYYPVQLRDAKNEDTMDFNQHQEAIRNGIFALFSGAGTSITPDYWGMLNSTSEYFCHYLPSKRPIAESVMFGPRQKNMMAMVEVLNNNSK